MLVLTRRHSETIKLGADITVKVLEVRGNQVTIGIDAPREIPIYREELLAKIQKERELEDHAVS